MSIRIRTAVFILAGAALLALLAIGMSGLEPFGTFSGAVGSLLNRVAVPERHVLNVVGAVIFDYRGFDTLGEEFILFASVTGVVLLLRHEHGSGGHRRHPRSASPAEPDTGDAVRAAARWIAATIWIFGAYVAVTGHLSVGGGFQGGVIASAAWLTLYLAHGRSALHRCVSNAGVEWFETAGAAGYVGIGLLGLLDRRTFLANVLPLGTPGNIFSAGTVIALNVLVGFEVAAGFVLLLNEFVKPLSDAPAQ